MTEDFDDPESYEGEGRSTGERSTDQTDGIVAKEEEWPEPILIDLAEPAHACPILLLLLLQCANERDDFLDFCIGELGGITGHLALAGLGNSN